MFDSRDFINSPTGRLSSEVLQAEALSKEHD